MGIVSQLVSQVVFIALVLTLYSLFKDVNRKHAMAMVTLVAVAVVVEFANCINLMCRWFSSVARITSPSSPRPQLDALALVFLRMRGGGTA